MRLVVNPEEVGKCTMVIGNIELPLTREQVVEMLFGSEYKLVPIKNKNSKNSKQKLKPKQKTKPKTHPKKPEDGPSAFVINTLSNSNGMTFQELRQAAAKFDKDFQADALSKTLWRLVTLKKIKRQDKPDAYKYLANQSADSNAS